MIDSRIEDGVLVLTISNPQQLNKLCAADYAELYQELLVYLSAPGERNGVVLIGAETPTDKRPAFSAGAEERQRQSVGLGELPRRHDHERLDRRGDHGERVHRRAQREEPRH